MKADEFLPYVGELGGHADAETYSAFSRYHDAIQDWSRRVRLVSKGDRHQIWSRHFLDSLAPLRLIPPGADILDLGSGAGFPGVPLKLCLPSCSLVLLESARMKSLFLLQLVERLDLKNTEVVHARAEQVERPSQADVVVVRAVASLDRVWDLGKRFLREGGVVIAHKGPEESSQLSDKAAQVERQVVKIPPWGRDRALIVVRNTEVSRGTQSGRKHS